MPLTDSMVGVAGFVSIGGKPIGSCFRVAVRSELRPSDPEWMHSYFVTAQHVVPPDGQDRRVWMTDAEGHLSKDIGPLTWHRPDGLDVAVAQAERLDRWWYTLLVPDMAVSREGVACRLGQLVHYIGLLKLTNNAAAMVERGQPMVRSSTLGALNVPDVSYDGGSWRAERSHLIDCRSRAGFSGSVCLIESLFTGPVYDPVPPMLTAEIRRRTGAEMQMGSLYPHASFFGMLVGYGDDPGVGVVIPEDVITDFLLSDPELVDMRREHDEKRAENEAAEPDELVAISGEDDERVSLGGLDFGDAMTALLHTPPKADD